MLVSWQRSETPSKASWRSFSKTLRQLSSRWQRGKPPRSLSRIVSLRTDTQVRDLVPLLQQRAYHMHWSAVLYIVGLKRCS